MNKATPADLEQKGVVAIAAELRLARAVLSGRGDEVIDLAKTNFLAR